MAGSVTNQHACTRLDWEAFALRNSGNRKLILLSLQIFIRIQVVVVFTTREGKDLGVPSALGKMFAIFLMTSAGKKAVCFSDALLWELPFSHKYYLG